MGAFVTMIGRTLLGMLMKWATKEGVEWLIGWSLESGLAEYEAKAARTPEDDDDRRAARLRDMLEKFKEMTD